MSPRSWVRKLFARKNVTPLDRRRQRPWLEGLEQRWLPAHTYTVVLATDTGGGGQMSSTHAGDLRYCINQADGDAGSTIQFDGTVFATAQTITLNGTELPVITANLTLTGPSAGVTVSGNQQSRVFEVGGGTAVSLSGLTISQGAAVGDNGGGVLVNGGASLGLTNCTLIGSTADVGGGLYNYRGTAALTNCTLAGNYASDGGGLDNFQGIASLSNCTLAGNIAESNGGGLASEEGAVALSNCTLAGNSGFSEGGGLANDGGSAATLTNCTLTGNYAGEDGGGLENRAAATLTNCTLAGNFAYFSGGGLKNFGSATLTDCTLAGNSAKDSGGGVYNGGGLAMTNTIVAGNTSPTGPDVYSDMYSQVTTATYCLIGDSAGNGISATMANGNLVGGGSVAPLNAQLAPLGYYGGPTQTMPLLPGSPARGAGSYALATDPQGNPLTTDQRGFALTNNNGHVDLGAFQTEAAAVNYLVETTADLGAFGQQSLRGAIGLADVYGGNPTITFDAAPGHVFAAPQTIALDGQELHLLQNMTIAGPNAGVTVSGNHLSRVFEVGSYLRPEATVALAGLTVTQGNAPAGGGILVNAGSTLTLTDCTVDGNSAQYYGGGLANQGTAMLTDCTLAGNSASLGGGLGNQTGTVELTRCTLSGNSTTYALTGGVEGGGAGGGGLNNEFGTARLSDCTFSGNTVTLSVSAGAGLNNSGGGGFHNQGRGGTATLSNCTFSGNVVALSAFGGARILNSGGGGLIDDNASALSLVNCTLNGNSVTVSTSGGGTVSTSGGGLLVYHATATLANTLVAANTAAGAPDVFNDTASVTAQNCLIGDGTASGLSATAANGNQVGTSAGPINALLAPLGNYGGPTQTMPLTVNSPARGAGSYALAVDATGNQLTTDQRGLPLTNHNGAVDLGAVQTDPLVVTTAADPGQVFGKLSLREAINLADAQAGPSLSPTITFDAAPGHVFAMPQTIALFGQELPVLLQNMTITGPAAALTVSGNQQSRVFEVGGGAVAISGLTVAQGFVSFALYGYNDIGGGILVNPGGSLTLANCTLSGNSAFYGGGLYTYNGSVGLSNCTLSGNAASYQGGGLYNNGGTAGLSNCTLSGNTTAYTGAGGGLFNNAGSAALSGCTLSGNAAQIYGGGLLNSNGTVGLSNCTVSNNSATYGGGLYNYQGTATLAGCTLSGNSTAFNGNGGGLLNDAGSVALSNCTLIGNIAPLSFGGGLYNASGTAGLSNCTLSGNSASQGGGLFNSGTATLVNSIVAGNIAISGPDAYQAGGALTAQYCLVGDGTGSGLTSVNGNQIGTQASPLNPRLAPLGSYGGPTQTMALLPGSPALDAGTAAGAPATDQRGYGRVGAVDLGAFESQGFTLTVQAGDNQQVLPNTALPANLVVRVTANNPAEPVAGGVVTFTAPASGPGGTFPGMVPTATAPIAGNGTTGTATAPPLTAGGTIGAFTVSATTRGGSTAVFHETVTFAGVVGGNLLVNGTNGADTIVVTYNAGAFNVYENGQTLLFSAGVTGRIIIYGNDGNDNLTVNGTFPAEIHAGNGTTVVHGGDGGNVVYGGSSTAARLTAYAGAGNDVLMGGAGTATLYGGRGKSVLIGGTVTGYTYDMLRALATTWATGTAQQITAAETALKAAITAGVADTLFAGTSGTWGLARSTSPFTGFMPGRDKKTLL